jgi:hypothetical protein
MPDGAHGDVPETAPAALAVGLGYRPAAGGVVAGRTGAGCADSVDVAAGVGLAHAPPYAAVGSTSRLFSAATDRRASAAARPDGECAPGISQAHAPSTTTPAHRSRNLRRQ